MTCISKVVQYAVQEQMFIQYFVKGGEIMPAKKNSVRTTKSTATKAAKALSNPNSPTLLKKLAASSLSNRRKKNKGS